MEPILQKLTLRNAVGLHARPAALFVKTAAQFHATLRVRNLTRATDWVNARSILLVLGLGVEQNHEIELSASGEDAPAAVQAIAALVQSNFGEAV
jgi:phosphotransferase system HPr (HPr) family protein